MPNFHCVRLPIGVASSRSSGSFVQCTPKKKIVRIRFNCDEFIEVLRLQKSMSA